MRVIQTIHLILWGPWTLLLFLGTGLFFIVRSGGFPVRRFGYWWHHTAGSIWKKEQWQEEEQKRQEKKQKETVSVFQSACTALAATIGTGNIVGVATALTAGGAGALFWMWGSAILGMATAYAETSLGQKFRFRRGNGSWLCGPMIYMERGLSCPLLGIFYAGAACLASLGMGSMVQANSIQETLEYGFGISPVLGAVMIGGSCGLVIIGGAKRIARVSEWLMPVAAGTYLLFSFAVIGMCLPQLPSVLAEILREAFCLKAVGGGVTGILFSKSVRYGMARGVFSNEAGLGSLAVLHGVADETTPQQQGMWAMFEVFFDTVIVCTLTGLVILCVLRQEGGNLSQVGDGAVLAVWCFRKKLGTAGELLVSLSMIIFAFATIIAWYYMGEQNVQYLRWHMGRKRRDRDVSEIAQKEDLYKILYLGSVCAGALCRVDLIWALADLCNALMAYPNLLSLWMLSGYVAFPETDQDAGEREAERKKKQEEEKRILERK